MKQIFIGIARAFLASRTAVSIGVALTVVSLTTWLSFQTKNPIELMLFIAVLIGIVFYRIKAGPADSRDPW